MTPRLPVNPDRLTALRAALFVAGYLLCCTLGKLLSVPSHGFVSVWLPSGYFLGILLRCPSRLWSPLALLALASNLAFNLATLPHLGLSLIFAAANVAEGLAGAALVRRFVAHSPSLASTRETAGFLALATGVGPAVNLLIAIPGLHFITPEDHLAIRVLLWWSGDALGVLLIAPLALSCGRILPSPPRIVLPRFLEALALALAIILTSYPVLVFEHRHPGGLKYCLLPWVILGAVRLGVCGACLATLAMTIGLSYAFQRLTPTPIGFDAAVTTRQILSQSFLAVAGLTGLVLAVLLNHLRLERDRLRQTEARTRALLEVPNSLTCLIDADGRILHVNQRFAAELARSKEELLCQPIRDFLPPSWAPVALRALQASLARRSNTGFEAPLGPTWYDHALSPILSESGEVEGVAWVAWNIRERKARENEIRRLGVLWETRSRISQMVARARFRDDLFRDACRILVDHGAFDAVRVDLWDDAGRTTESLHARAADQPPDSQLPTGNLSPPATTISVPLLLEGRTIGILHVMVAAGTITEDHESDLLDEVGMELNAALDRLHAEHVRRATETALRESEERFRRIVESSQAGYFLIDRDGRYLNVNDAWLRMHRLPSRDQVIGRHYATIIHTEEGARADDVFERVLDGEAIHSGETSRRLADGSIAHLTFSAQPVRKDGDITGMEGFLIDITERCQLESQLRQAQKLEAVGQLAGGIAHDFNNIIAAALMHLALLRSRSEVDPETRSMLLELEADARRAMALTRQLLLFARRSIMEKCRVDLNEIVENLIKLLRRLIGEHISIEWHGGQNVPSVDADPGMMEQVIMNLCLNARDAMPDGGRLMLTTFTAHFDPGVARSNPEARPGTFVCLRGSDTGRGIDPAVIPHIFEPFFTTKGPAEGTGLGLATVYGILKQHQGWIDVASRLGGGSTFSAYFPAAASTHPPTPFRPPPPVRGSETVLLVEDESSLRRSSAQMLRILGYRVFEAANGVEGLDLWRRHAGEIDLLFTDMVMPSGVSGLELSRRLREDSPELPVIITTGYTTEFANDGVPNIDGILFIPKPYEPAALADAIRASLAPKLESKE